MQVKLERLPLSCPTQPLCQASPHSPPQSLSCIPEAQVASSLPRMWPQAPRPAVSSLSTPCPGRPPSPTRGLQTQGKSRKGALLAARALRPGGDACLRAADTTWSTSSPLSSLCLGLGSFGTPSGPWYRCGGQSSPWGARTQRSRFSGRAGRLRWTEQHNGSLPSTAAPGPRHAGELGRAQRVRYETKWGCTHTVLPSRGLRGAPPSQDVARAPPGGASGSSPPPRAGLEDSHLLQGQVMTLGILCPPMTLSSRKNWLLGQTCTGAQSGRAGSPVCLVLGKPAQVGSSAPLGLRAVS